MDENSKQLSTDQEKDAKPTIADAYEKRKKSFVRSLRGILIKISEDPVVRQMLQSRTSGEFIMRRVEEIMREIISDDREKFFGILVQRVTAYDQLYSKEKTEEVKRLGNRILELSDQQSAGEVSAFRKIRSLSEQVEALQAEVVTLRTQQTHLDPDIIEGNHEPDSEKKSFVLNPSHDPASPTFLHVFRKIDLTDMKTQIKLIQTDAMTSKRAFTLLMNKMKTVFAATRNKTKQEMRKFARKVMNLNAQNEKASLKVAELQRHYEEEVIPQLRAKHKEKMATRKKLAEERETEMENMRSVIQDTEIELKTLKNELRKAESQNMALNHVITENAGLISNLKAECSRQKEVIQRNNSCIQQQRSEIGQLQRQEQVMNEEQEQNIQENRKLKENLEESTRKVDQLESELEQLKSCLPKTKTDLETSRKEVSDLRIVNKRLSDELNTAKREMMDLRRKVEKLEPALAKRTGELKDVKQKYELTNEENEENKRVIDSLKRDLEQQQQVIVSMENTQQGMKADTDKKSEAIEELETEKGQLQTRVRSLEANIKRLTDSKTKLEKQVKEHTENGNKQLQQIESMQEENDKLRKNLSTLNRKQKTLEGNLSRTQIELETATSKIAELSQIKETHEQQIALHRQEKDELKTKVKELTGIMRDTQEKDASALNDAANENKQLRSNIDTMSSKVAELEADIKSLSKQKEEKENMIVQQERQISELSQDKAGLLAKHSEALDLVKQGEVRIEEISKENRTYKKALTKIQAFAPQVADLKSLPTYFKSLLDEQQSVCSKLGVSQVGDALNVVDALKEKGSAADQVCQLMGQSSLDVTRIQKMREELNQMKSERETVMALLKKPADSDLVTAVNNCVTQHSAQSDELKANGNFIELLANRLSGSKSPKKVSLPLQEEDRNRILVSITKLKEKLASRSKQIEKVLEQARAMGYTGNDCLEACDFISTRLSDIEKQKIFETVNAELNAVREALVKEQELRSKEKESTKKRISDLRSALSQQQSSGAQREESLQLQIEELEAKLREANESLETERRVREELGRIGAGASADSKYLRSKLSANEFRLVTFVERIMKQERESQQLHEKQKQMREALLGESVSFGRS